jgi:hypothetical protein
MNGQTGEARDEITENTNGHGHPSQAQPARDE